MTLRMMRKGINFQIDEGILGSPLRFVHSGYYKTNKIINNEILELKGETFSL